MELKWRITESPSPEKTGGLVWHDVSAQRKPDRRSRFTEIDAMSGQEFEKVVAELLRARGYQTKLTDWSGDHGVDIVATKGQAVWAVQVKKSSQPVSRRAVSDAVGGMAIYGCNGAMVVTSASFTAGAIELAEANDCELVPGERVLEWMDQLATSASMRRAANAFSSVGCLVIDLGEMDGPRDYARECRNAVDRFLASDVAVARLARVPGDRIAFLRILKEATNRRSCRGTVEARTRKERGRYSLYLLKTQR